MENGVPIRSVSRTLSVLRTINLHGSLSMMAIAKHEDLPYPTAFRIVQTLVHEGLIERERVRKHYRPTALVQSLSSGYAPGTLSERAQPHLSALTREVGWPIFLSVRVGSKMVIRASTHHETTLTFDPCYPGASIPLFGSATGHVWLAELADDNVRDMVRWGPGLTEKRGATLSAEELFERLAEVRRDGFDVRACLNNRANKTASVAVPVLKSGTIEGVVTLTYFAAAMRQEKAVELYLAPLQRAAERISVALEDPLPAPGYALGHA